MRTPVASRSALTAALLMVGSAAISAYWAAGGTALLDTVGGSIARWGREGGVEVRLALGAIVLLKLFGAWLPVAALRTRRPLLRRLAWLEAAGLTVYGGVLTAAGLAVQVGLIAPGRSADWTALDWHAYLWDPWFLVAGGLMLTALPPVVRGRISTAAGPPTTGRAP